MKKETWLSIDPGGVNFACTFIKNNKALWMGYHPYTKNFTINKIEHFDNFVHISEIFVSYCSNLIIERFIPRQANAKVSSEKLNLMIGTLLTIAHLKNKKIIAVTSSTWKRKYNYSLCIESAYDIGFLKKDSHFVDTILMYAVINNKKENYYSILQNSLTAYNNFRKDK